MAININSSLFRQIISRDNRHNLDILDKYMHAVIGSRVRDIALCMTKGMDGWVYKYIIHPDNEEFKSAPDALYLAKAILMAADLKAILGDSFAGDAPEPGSDREQLVNLAGIDLAGWCKLVRFRFLSRDNINDFFTGESREQIDPFVFLISRIGWLRNEIAHERAGTIAHYENRRNFLKVLEDFSRLSGQAADCAVFLRAGEGVSQILKEIKTDTDEFREMYELSKDSSPIKKDSAEYYPAEYLYGYDRVYLAYPGCRNKDYTRFVTGALNPLMIIGRSNLAADTGTVEYLAELSESRDPAQAAEAKKLYKEFNNSLKDTLSLTRSDDANEVFLNYADAFLKKLEEAGENICVLTDDEYVCRRISRMPDNIIAVTVTDPEHVMPYLAAADLPKKEQEIPGSVKRSGEVLIPGRLSSVYYGDPENNIKYTLGKCIGEGGEGNIYQTDIGKECFKIYHDHKLNRQRQEKILAMITCTSLREDRRICWPIQPVFESSSRRALVGFSMRDVTFEAGSGAVPLDDVMISLHNNDRLHWRWSRSDLVNLCMNIAEITAAVHSQGVMIGDINPKNFLVDREGEAFLIDTDSCQIGGFVCPVGIPEYSSPSLWEHDCQFALNPRTLQDEYFALARLFYFILFIGGSPYRFEKNRIDIETLRDCITNKKFIQESLKGSDFTWLNLSEDVRDNFRNVFSSGDGKDHPEMYPDEKKWLNALYGMANEIKAGRLSDDLKPYDAVMSPDEEWQDKTCSRCGHTFRVAHNVNEELCPGCRELFWHNSSRIMRVRCSRCGRKFITNLWELAELNHFRSKEDIICPDCDSRVKMMPNGGISREEIDRLLKEIDKRISERRMNDGSDQTG